MTSSFEEQINETHMLLERALGTNYSIYRRLLESFLCGRIIKEEFEGALRGLLKDSLTNYDLHNKYVGLVLEKLSAAENEAIAACTVDGHDSSLPMGEGSYKESATLHLLDIQLTATDVQFFREALAQGAKETGQKSDDDADSCTEEERLDRFNNEMMLAEKTYGRPLFCQLGGRILEPAGIRLLLASWLKAYDLDLSSIDEEQIALIVQGLEDYLREALRHTLSRCIPGEAGGQIKIDVLDLLASAHLEHSPLLNYEYTLPPF